MADLPLTQPSLLIRIRDARDTEAWQRFVSLYAPLMYGFARKRGLQDSDAADLTQDVLRSVAMAAAGFNYDPRRGTFHGWLFTVVHNKLQDFLAKQSRLCRGSGDTDVLVRLEEQVSPPHEDEAFWNREYERQLMARALELVRGSFQDLTWQAFWQTAIEGKKAKEVAAGLGLSVAAVYMAKSRVIAQLKEQVRQLQKD
ncbi:MAG TPA: sigma-70 family RNA polymerase sigma factor [Gemmataceae bacterium]|nr:sigma-70 family RNA polymerase sigma factor [Gemmataceae bacterium]